MKVSFNFENAEELNELFERATTLTKELQEVLQQIQNFELKIQVANKSRMSNPEVSFIKASKELLEELNINSVFR